MGRNVRSQVILSKVSMAARGATGGEKEAPELPDGEGVLAERDPRTPGVSQCCPAWHQPPHPPLLPHSPSKRKMQRISNLSITVMYVMYFLAALFGYLTFYGLAGPWGAEAEARLGGKGLASGQGILHTIGAH